MAKAHGRTHPSPSNGIAGCSHQSREGQPLIIVDASAVIELLLDTPKGQQVAEIALAKTESLHAPQLIDLEVAQSLRRFVRSRQLSSTRGRLALEDFETLGIIRYSHGPLIPRIWDLRDNFTAYDAAYLALAEELDSPLLTRDAKLSAAAGRHTRIRVI